MQQHSFDLEQDPRGDLLRCRDLLRHGSKSFFAASYLLPHSVRTPATALYAFCRLADDAVDGPDARPQAIETLYRRLEMALGGTPWPLAADRAFARVMAAHAIPHAVPRALIEGLAWDAAGRRYETIDDLHGYAARVAGTVGIMVGLVMGVRSPALLARACDLGIAMQLTNIARDVGEDAAAGRLYLPLAWLREAGVDPDAWLENPQFTPAIANVTGKLLQEADAFYERADAGIAALPVRCRPGIRAARLVYAEIGREVARAGHDSITRRAIVPASRKLTLLAQAVLPPRAAPHYSDFAVSAASRFLLDATAHLEPAKAPPAWWNVNAQMARLIEIWDRLERRERAAL
jgi:phytoene synthase